LFADFEKLWDLQTEDATRVVERIASNITLRLMHDFCLRIPIYET
jgi:hypothetical protein